MEYQIDLGEHTWKHPKRTYGYFTEESAISDAKAHDLDPKEIVETDTRMEIWRVAAQLEDEERVWDEGGVSAFPTVDRSAKWPEGRTRVFVVTGGSEGLYLHVEVEVAVPYSEPKVELLLIAKTLSCGTDKWYECWLSAARIARLLGA